ncbi:MAG: MOSC N-terminal beta barrel domain-containing protein [Pseudomonadota bacterium]
MSIALAGLFIHPVKSAAGIACERARLAPYGLEHDREWMIVDPAGRFVTQREEARLALLATAIGNGLLQLSNPQGSAPALPLEHDGEPREVRVWNSTCTAFDAGDAMAQFLSDWLARPLRLVRFDRRHARLSNHEWTAGRDVSTLFSDGYPLLVLSQGSLADLSARVGTTLPPQRFRPNLLLGGLDPYGEDAIDAIEVAGARIHLTKACTRCVITTIDHESGERTGDEPLRTLKSYRFDRELRGVIFGRNAYMVRGEGVELRVGMPVSPAPPL